MKHVFRFLIALALVTGIAAAGFYAYTYAQTPNLITQSGSNSSEIIISQLNQLSSLTLNTAIFQTPAFISLQDFSVPVLPEPVSRPNPFAPIGQDSGL